MRTTTNESAERQNITNEPVLETSILTDDELKGVSGGDIILYPTGSARIGPLPTLVHPWDIIGKCDNSRWTQ